MLIDGSPLIFRAHFGIDTVLTRKDGTVVTAVFGFTRLLLKLREAVQADYVGVFLDDKQVTFRKEMFDSYKAQRKSLPESLITQLPIIEDASRALGLFTMKVGGFEADDLIATYARKAREEGHRVTIVSPDKDMMQLVRGSQVVLFDPGKRVLYDEEGVKHRWGVAPELVPYVQALSGDKSDNIPGACGIGPKIAAKLMEKYGSIEGLRSRLGEESKRVQKIITTYEAEIDMSLKLATLDSNVRVIRGSMKKTCVPQKKDNINTRLGSFARCIDASSDAAGALVCFFAGEWVLFDFEQCVWSNLRCSCDAQAGSDCAGENVGNQGHDYCVQSRNCSSCHQKAHVHVGSFVCSRLRYRSDWN